MNAVRATESCDTSALIVIRHRASLAARTPASENEVSTKVPILSHDARDVFRPKCFKPSISRT